MAEPAAGLKSLENIKIAAKTAAKSKIAKQTAAEAEAALISETPKSSKTSKSSKKTTISTEAVEAAIQSPERIQLPSPEETTTQSKVDIISNWDDLSIVFTEQYQLNMAELIQNQQYDTHIEAREQIELTVTDSKMPGFLKNAAQPKRPTNWNNALFKYYQNMQRKIIKMITLEEFLECSIIRLRVIVSTTIYKRKRYSSFRRNP